MLIVPASVEVVATAGVGISSHLVSEAQADCCRREVRLAVKEGLQTWCNGTSDGSASCLAATVAKQFKQIESDDPSIFGRWGCVAEA
jgi:hypothetical protein